MTWRQHLAAIERDLTLYPGCSEDDLIDAERRLGTSFPNDLRTFLAETNGVHDNDSQYGYGWDLKTIVKENLWARQEEDPLDPDLLAFGSDGAGGWFCLPIDQRRREVLHWDWIDLEARRVAPDLRSFWAGWLSWELTV